MAFQRILGAAALTLLVGGGAAATAYSLVDVPTRAEVEIAAPVKHGVSTVEVHDPGNVLSESDEQRLFRDTTTIDTVESVQQVHFIVLDKNRQKMNDSIEEYLRDHRPDLIGKDSYTDGVLIVGLGLDPRQAFIGAGDDIARDLDLRESKHLDVSLDAIKPGVRDGNIPAGLFAGLREATDVEKLADATVKNKETDRITATAVSGGLAGGAVLTAAGIAAAVRKERKKKLEKTRDDLQFVSREYGELAQRLDAIDIRAHSLTSPLAHATMRAQWAEVRDHFLQLHGEVDSFGGLTPSSDPKLMLERSKQIGTAADVARKVGFAEENIDTLFKLEHGDEVVRKHEVSELRADIVAAQAAVKNKKTGLFYTLDSAKKEAEALQERVTSADFLERYARLLSDYQTALKTLQKQEFSDLEKPDTKPQAPAVYEQDYRPGYGYGDFVPFWALSTWHSEALATQQAAASSATDTTYSSGFSGAGGSSSF